MRRLASLRVLWILLVALGLLATACQSSPTAGKWFFGESLAINMLEMYKVKEVRYSQGEEHYLVQPKEPGNELVVVHLDVRNRHASRAIFTVDEDAMFLRDADYNEYKPINPLEQRSRVDEAGRLEDRFVPFIWGPLELPKGWGVSGWVVFEVPKGLEFVQLVWDAGDTIYIRF
jgi:hypothetical protein